MDKVEPGKYYQVGPRTFWVSLAERMVPSFLLIVLAFFISNFQGSEPFLQYFRIFDLAALFLFLATILFIVISIVVSLLEYRTSRIMMDGSSFHVVRGILSKHEISIPYRRVQSVEIKQSLLYRIFGIGRVIISTTTDIDQPTSDNNYEYNDEVISAMDYPLARLVEKTLTDRAEIERIEVKE